MNNVTLALKTKPYLLLLLFFVISISLYAPALKGGFVIDDMSLVVNNTFIKNLKFLPQLFTKDIYYFSSEKNTNYYRPLLLATFAADYAVWKLKPFGYHLTNVLFHAINSYLVFLMLLSLFARWRLAFISALFFCIHPIHISAVSYISGRADLLVTSFMLLSLTCLLSYLKTSNSKKYVASLLLFVLALLSRESAIFILPLAILIILMKRPVNKNSFAAMLGFVVIVAFYLINRSQVITTNIAVIWPKERFFPLSLEMLNFLNILKKYALIIILPWPLYLMRTTPPVYTLTFTDALFFVFIAVLLFFAIRDFKKNRGEFSFGFFWAAITLAPLIKMMYLLPSLGLAMAEHWLYIPSIGIFVIISRLLSSFKKFPKVLFTLLVCFNAGLSFFNNNIWKDELTIYKNTLKFTPHNEIILHNLGNLYFERKEEQKAIEVFNYLISRNENSWRAYNELGNIYYLKGDLKNAEKFYKRCLEFNPKNEEVNYNLGIVYESLNEGEKAFNQFLKALECNSEFSLGYYGLGSWYLKRGLYSQALPALKRALELNPDNFMIYIRLGITLFELKHYKQGKEAFLQGLKLKPDSILALENIGLAYGNAGMFDTAIRVWKEALRLNPENNGIREKILKTEELKKTVGGSEKPAI